MTFQHNNVKRQNCTLRGRSSQKTQKLITKFPDLAISGRHNSAKITDLRKFTVKLTVYGMSSFHF